MKYEKLGFAIAVSVNEEYTVRANIVKIDSQNTYDVTLEIKRNDIGYWAEIPNDEVYRFESKCINCDVANYILRIYKEGYFSPIIKGYEYWVECNSLGNEVFEIQEKRANGKYK